MIFVGLADGMARSVVVSKPSLPSSSRVPLVATRDAPRCIGRRAAQARPGQARPAAPAPQSPGQPARSGGLRGGWQDYQGARAGLLQQHRPKAGEGLPAPLTSVVRLAALGDRRGAGG